MLKKALGVVVLCGVSVAAQAVTVDLRHEYIDAGTNADRVAVSHRFENGLGFSVEAKWKSGGTNKDEPFADLIGNGHEDQISWRWKASNNIAITPALTVESTDNRTIWKPNLHAQYSFDNGFYVAARYRYEYTRYPNDAKKDDDKVNRGDLWAGFVLGDWRTELNYVYAKSQYEIRSNNKKDSQEYNVKVAYKWDKNWAPYAELGNVSGSKTADERQTRYRVGVAYSF
ncbi:MULTISPECIES: porin [Buttiauxella]|uniref:Oligogalacturonate-specific porin protein n=1 Tax=Buttiauxella ferragutiae ATCC 51602 TaxID=1354252 RepID=A0ABX2W9U0_9ENTR|nr:MULTISPECIES: porin [Buttiauxella]AYN29049.1 porin [Buttiauxella sp. 3AFRM03]MCE0827378.1 porin [Buttiauxella ferragutiae]OAT28772.1 oligogalacturonate-specific porin protein [Buttiauxella ferragutiae ATCC 51602]TDN52909.1 oligogalacturonate-specific porin [Buttiauxella sp. JUb87]UNK62160.1 porin [Buttiauxella ferragutiae]